MKTRSISKLARQVGLSRSTLLYYDRIRLLPPSGRTGSGYRYYTEADERRLKKICDFRQAGLSLADIRNLLSAGMKPATRIFAERLQAIGNEIVGLKNQQRLLNGLLKKSVSGKCPPTVDKAMWVDMLRAAGMDARAMNRWHIEFEKRAPQAHHDFLVSLGLSEPEITQIRAWSARSAKVKQAKGAPPACAKGARLRVRTGNRIQVSEPS